MRYHCSASGQHMVKNSACSRIKSVSKECLALPPAYAAAGELYKFFHYLTPPHHLLQIQWLKPHPVNTAISA